MEAQRFPTPLSTHSFHVVHFSNPDIIVLG